MFMNGSKALFRKKNPLKLKFSDFLTTHHGDDEVYMTFPQLVSKYGFDVEVH